jgi:hypothetical protein
VARLHLRQHVELFQHPVRFGDQRLANVEARETLSLEKLYRDAFLGQQRGHSRACRPSADHDDIGTRPSAGARGVASLVEGRDSGFGVRDF